MRMSEEQYAEQSAKRARWQKGSEIINTDSTPDAAPRKDADASSPLVRATSGTPSKYRNEKTNGYASRKEAKRAAELKYLQKAGVIRNLREQVLFVLIPKQEGERACSYIADFAYDEDARTPMQETRTWRPVVEDCKGFKTDVFIVKRKLMLMVHGIRVRET